MKAIEKTIPGEEMSYGERQDHIHRELKKVHEHVTECELRDIKERREYRLNFNRIQAQK